MNKLLKAILGAPADVSDIVAAARDASQADLKRRYALACKAFAEKQPVDPNELAPLITGLNVSDDQLKRDVEVFEKWNKHKLECIDWDANYEKLENQRLGASGEPGYTQPVGMSHATAAGLCTEYRWRKQYARKFYFENSELLSAAGETNLPQ